MTKKDIVNEVAEEARQPKTRIAAALDIFLAEVTGAMVRQERVEIRRFGTFEVTHRKSRVARNFSADEEITLPARAVPRFVPFKAFKDLVERARPLQDETTVPPPQTPETAPASPAVKAPDRPVQTDPVESLRDAVARNDQDTDARLALAEALMATGKQVDAANEVRAVLQCNGSNIKALNLQGLIHEEQDSDERALQEYEKAYRVDRDDVNTLINMGKLRSKLGDHGESESHFKRVKELNPDHVEACFHLGILHTKRGLYGRAIQDFERVTQLDPENIEAYFQLGKTYDHLERYDDAIRMFEELLKVQADNDRAYWHLGKLYDKMKDSAKALEMYQKSNQLTSSSKKDRR